MIRVEPACSRDYGRVAPLLKGFNNPKITGQQWRSLFEYSWPASVPVRGFLLLDEDKVVGFFGTIWSERVVASRTERICNLSSWITLPEYRNQSLLLLKEVMALKECTITCVSPAPHLYPLYKRFGFADLETKLRIILPWPSGRMGWSYRITTRPHAIAQRLKPEDRAIFEAHRPHACRHLVVSRGDDYCYLIFTKTRGKRYHFAHPHFISNRELFVRALDRIKMHLFLATGTPLIMVDERLVSGLEIPHSRSAQLGIPHVYRSATLAPEQIDNIYSELILLGL